MRAYEPIIHPVKAVHMWPKTQMIPPLPPLVKKQPGRPKKRRIVNDAEMERKPNNFGQVKLTRKGGTVTCQRCWQKGHNMGSCKNQPRAPPKGVYVDKRYATKSQPSSAKTNSGKQRTKTIPKLPVSSHFIMFLFEILCTLLREKTLSIWGLCCK